MCHFLQFCDGLLVRSSTRLVAATSNMASGSGEERAYALWPWQPAISRKAAAPTTLNSHSSPPGATCRTTPAMTRQAAICNHWSTSSTNTARTPSSPRSTNLPTKIKPRSPSQPHTRPKAANGPVCGSQATSHRPATATNRTTPDSPFPARLTTPKPGSPTSPSPGPATASTSAASPGSTNTPTESLRPTHLPRTFDAWCRRTTAVHPKTMRSRRTSHRPHRSTTSVPYK